MQRSSVFPSGSPTPSSSAPVQEDIERLFHEELRATLMQLHAKCGKVPPTTPGMATIKSIIGALHLDPSLNTFFMGKMDDFSREFAQDILKRISQQSQQGTRNENQQAQVRQTQQIQTHQQEKIIEPRPIPSYATSEIASRTEAKQETDDALDLKPLDIPIIQSKTDTGLIIEIQNVRALRGQRWTGAYCCSARYKDRTEGVYLLHPSLNTWADRVGHFVGPDKSFFVKFYRLPDGTYHAETSLQMSS